ncbi:MAG: CPBP family intramembrane metalloprotease [Phycisphaerales bacterium]|nr:CPBP family intramembrane metalloprotease [Phycisphaerales bacterium]
MTRLHRVNTIWRKELTDTLRDRRTLIAMVLVPMALYPAMILGSLQGFELQIARLKREQYRVLVATEPGPHGPAVSTQEAALWLRTAIDTDPTRRPGAETLPAEVLVEKAARGELPAETQPADAARSAEERAREDVRRQPPKYEVEAARDAAEIIAAIQFGQAHAGVLVRGPLPSAADDGASVVVVLTDQTDIRSQIAASGLESILERLGKSLLRQRLKRQALSEAYITPLVVSEQATATPEKVGGSILGQIVPLILIVMTITGAVYPAIDLTAGERERGTLETLMVAPVPTVDLIAGKFVVVALIGMLSAALNLLSIGGTIYLGGLGELLTRGSDVVIPLGALPWVLLLLVPLAVLFSALLLAVCSFARSFKEAQNYVMPVMVAAMIPAIVGILPGTRLDGPMLVMPVTNITILTRDLFTGKFDPAAIVWVTASTTLYAGAAVAVAARLFGQEAVLFADSGSVRTLFQRRFFRPSERPSVAQAFLMLAVTFSLNFFAQQSLLRPLTLPGQPPTPDYFAGVAAIILIVFVALPAGTAAYLKTRLRSTFALGPAPLRGWLAAACFGLSTWILASAWFAWQSQWLPVPAEMTAEFERVQAGLAALPVVLAILYLAVVPAVGEELLFRGYALGGLRSLGAVAAIGLTALAFGLHHHSIFRIVITAGLGVLFGLLVVRFGSVWPAVLAHFMHNGIALLSIRGDGLQPLLERFGYAAGTGAPPGAWTAGAALLAAVGLLLCLPARPPPQSDSSMYRASGSGLS